MVRALLVLMLLSLPALWPTPLLGQSRARTSQIDATLVPEMGTLQPGVPLRVAVRLRIAPGWHIYWHNPGESGLPTTVQWSGPAGFRVGSIAWPYPERRELAGQTVHVYDGDVVIVSEIHPPPTLTANRAAIIARVSWGVCREVCIPQDVQLAITLPVRPEPAQRDRRWNRLAAAAEPRLARTVPEWTSAAGRTEHGVLLQLTTSGATTLPRGPLIFFPDQPSEAAAVVSADAAPGSAGLIVQLKMPAYRTEPGTHLRGVLVARSGWDADGMVRALRIDVPVVSLRPE